MEFDKNSPIYLQIVSEIKRRLISGQLNSGDKMPSVRDLAEELKVNPNTIVRAYQELERENITESRRGMGTFIVSGSQTDSATLKAEIGYTITKAFLQRMYETRITYQELLEYIKKANDELESNS